MNGQHLAMLGRLLDGAAARSLPLWLSGGWAIDARLGRITREHEDIDLTFPAEREADFMDLLASVNAVPGEVFDYGFLAHADGVMLDCEPCHWNGKVHEIEDTPPGSCPAEAQGIIGDRQVRCTSWEAILWDYFCYHDEVPQSEWRPKDVASYALVRSVVGEAASDRLHTQFKGLHPSS